MLNILLLAETVKRYNHCKLQQGEAAVCLESARIVGLKCREMRGYARRRSAPHIGCVATKASLPKLLLTDENRDLHSAKYAEGAQEYAISHNADQASVQSERNQPPNACSNNGIDGPPVQCLLHSALSINIHVYAPQSSDKNWIIWSQFVQLLSIICSWIPPFSQWILNSWVASRVLRKRNHWKFARCNQYIWKGDRTCTCGWGPPKKRRTRLGK